MGSVGYIFFYMLSHACAVTYAYPPIRSARKRTHSPLEAYLAVWWMENPVFDPHGASPNATHKRPRQTADDVEAAGTPPSKASRGGSPGCPTRCMGRLSCPVPADKDTNLVLPRTAVGLNMLYTVICRDSTGMIQEARGHWLCDDQRDDVELLTITA